MVEKRQHGHVAEALHIDLALDVREDVHHDPGANALFVADQQNVFQLGKFFRFDGEDDLVDHVLADGRCQLVQFADGIGLGQVNLRTGRAGRIHKTDELHTVFLGGLQPPAHLAGLRAASDDQVERLCAELAPNEAAQSARADAIDQQEDQVVGGEKADEQAADVELRVEKILESDQTDPTEKDLQEGVADRRPSIVPVKLVINIEPRPDAQPKRESAPQKKRLDRRDDEKRPRQGQRHARLVGRLKGADGENHVRQRKKDDRFLPVTIKHGSSDASL